MASAFAWAQAHWGLIVGTLVVVANEIVAWSPKLASNSIIQFVLRLKAPANQALLK